MELIPREDLIQLIGGLMDEVGARKDTDETCAKLFKELAFFKEQAESGQFYVPASLSGFTLFNIAGQGTLKDFPTVQNKVETLASILITIFRAKLEDMKK